MPVVRPYLIGEGSPQPIPNAQPGVAAAAGGGALFGGNQARDLQVAGQQLGQAGDPLFALYERRRRKPTTTGCRISTDRLKAMVGVEMTAWLAGAHRVWRHRAGQGRTAGSLCPCRRPRPHCRVRSSAGRSFRARGRRRLPG